MYNLIELTKNYFFCIVCGKCYIYKGSYEKHKLNCTGENNYKMNNNIKKNIIIKNKTFNKEWSLYNNRTDNYTNEIIKKSEIKLDNREKLKINELNRDKLIVEIICPFYLFFCSLILGMIKLIFCGET